MSRHARADFELPARQLNRAQLAGGTESGSSATDKSTTNHIVIQQWHLPNSQSQVSTVQRGVDCRPDGLKSVGDGYWGAISLECRGSSVGEPPNSGDCGESGGSARAQGEDSYFGNGHGRPNGFLHLW